MCRRAGVRALVSVIHPRKEQPFLCAEPPLICSHVGGEKERMSLGTQKIVKLFQAHMVKVTLARLWPWSPQGSLAQTQLPASDPGKNWTVVGPPKNHAAVKRGQQRGQTQLTCHRCWPSSGADGLPLLQGVGDQSGCRAQYEGDA